MAETFFKDPDSVRWATWDWTDWLADGESVTGATITTTGGITAGTPSYSGGLVVTCLISGGTVGTAASATCRITTSTGQTEDWTLNFNIREA